MVTENTKNLKALRARMRSTSERSRDIDSERGVSSLPLRLGLLFGLSLIFALVLTPSLVTTHNTYHLGDVAERDIKAAQDFFIEDQAATEANRRRAVENVLTVYDYDAALSGNVTNTVDAAFSKMRNLIEAYSNEEIQPESGQTDTEMKRPTLHDQIWSQKDGFEATLGIDVSKGAYGILEKEKFSSDISHKIVSILTAIMENGVVANKEVLLRESDRGITLREVGTKTEREVRNLRQFYGLDQAKTMVRIVGQPLVKNLNYSLINLVVDFSQRLIQPNITLNRSATEERKNRVAKEIKPVMYKIKAGEMLLREGERVTEVQLMKLQAMQANQRKQRVFSVGIGAAMILMCLLTMTYLIYLRQEAWPGRDQDRNLIFLASTLIVFFLMAQISIFFREAITHTRPYGLSPDSITYGIPLAAGAMIICLFTGIELALPFTLVLATCTTIIFQNRFDIFLYFIINGAMAAFWIQHRRERKSFIMAGVKVGLLNIFLVSAIDIYIGSFSGMKILWDWVFAFIGGVGAAIVTIGLTPLFEMAFGYTTDVTLMELGNLDKPTLRKLMIEAPGTYHHSVVVGSMVEAAASEIGANPLMAKVCGYYHDIGKLRKPLYFIENQSNGKNPHDKLAPSMSSLILISHIKDGVEIAKENKLGREIIDTIRQHHGTSQIQFFYEKAKQQKGEEMVDPDGYRYPGPRPQTKEAGLVMLADVVEAASRTLSNPTPSRIQGLVQNLINKVFSDGQLDNCELTLKDLHNIAKSFNKILNGIHHYRIEYAENLTMVNGKAKNGGSDRQPPGSTPDSPDEDTGSGKSRLKRLGQS